MKQTASGTFNLDRWDEEQPHLERDGVKLTRAHIEKTFQGDLVGTSRTDITMVHTAAGPAAYVGLELVEGALHGRKGTFLLQHGAGGTGGVPWMTWKIVETSGTGELAGLRGEGKIVAEQGRHSYTLDYELD